MKTPQQPPPRETAPIPPFLLFNLVLFFTGVGGVFFRMARDNDDLVRTALVLSAASFVTFLVAKSRIRVPLSLSLPCLAFGASQFLASFPTVNPAESLKEFIKTGYYMIIFLTLASAAASRGVMPDGKPDRRTPAIILLIWGLVAGLLHAVPRFPTFRMFPLWSDQQVIASLVSAAAFCGALAFILARGTLRQAITAGGVAMAVIACLLGIGQFYDIDPLRPWDPRHPYLNPIRHLPEDVLTLLAAITGGALQRDQSGAIVLTVPRILGIYGNPDFFAPYLMQFIPYTVAVAALDPRLRVRAVLIGGALALVLGLTAVWGAFLSLVLLAPFFAVLLYFAAGRISREQAFRTSGILLAAGAATAAILTLALWRTAAKRPAIEERVVKWRLAAEMWERSPLVGIGLNAYKVWYPRIQQEVRIQHELPFEMLGSSFTQENRTHNDIAQMVGETGAIGLGMFAWFMAALIATGLASLTAARSPGDRATICGLLGGVLVTLIYALPNFPFHIVSSAATFWMMAGLLASFRVVPAPAAASGPFRPGTAKALLVAAGLTALITSVYSFKVFWGTLFYKRADFYSRIARPPDPVRAARLYRIALDLDGSNAQYAYDYGAMCFNAMKENAELAALAEPMLLRSLNWGFTNEDLAYGLGNISEKKGDLKQALYWYTYATRLNERHEASRQGRLRILLIEMGDAEKAAARKDWKQARILYEAALKRNPGNFLALYKLGMLRISAGQDFAGGIPFLDQAARLARNEPTMYVTLGRAYATVSRFEDSYRSFRIAHALDPKNADISGAIAQLEVLLGLAPPPPPGTGTPAPAGR